MQKRANCVGVFPAFQGLPALALTSSLALSSDGTILASGSWGGGMGLWDLKTGDLITTLPGHKKTRVRLDRCSQ